MDAGADQGEVNLSLNTKDEGDAPVTNETSIELQLRSQNDEKSLESKVDNEDPGSDGDNEGKLDIVTGTDNPAFADDAEDNHSIKDDKKTVEEDMILETRKDNVNDIDEQLNQNVDEDYFSVDSNSNTEIAELEESGTDLKRWDAKLELNSLEVNDKNQKKEPISNGKARETKKSKPSPFKEAFFLSKYITFW